MTSHGESMADQLAKLEPRNRQVKSNRNNKVPADLADRIEEILLTDSIESYGGVVEDALRIINAENPPTDSPDRLSDNTAVGPDNKTRPTKPLKMSPEELSTPSQDYITIAKESTSYGERVNTQTNNPEAVDDRVVRPEARTSVDGLRRDIEKLGTDHAQGLISDDEASAQMTSLEWALQLFEPREDTQTETEKSISELRKEIEEINISVRRGQMDDAGASARVRSLEWAIRLLEKELKRKAEAVSNEHEPETEAGFVTKSAEGPETEEENVPSIEDVATGSKQPDTTVDNGVESATSELNDSEQKSSTEINSTSLRAERGELRANLNKARDNYHTALKTSYQNRSLLSRSYGWAKEKGGEWFDSLRKKEPAGDGEQDMSEAEPAFSTLSDEASEYYDNLPFLKRVFGADKSDENPDVQAAKAAFDEANKAYYKHGKESGVYDRVNAWLRARPKPSDQAGNAIAKRHFLRPSEKRLELLSAHLPEKLASLKNELVQQIANNKEAVALFGVIVFMASPVRTAAITAAGLMAKLYIDIASKQEKVTRAEIVEGIFDKEDVDLDKLEQIYFDNLLTSQKARRNAKVALTATALATGGLLMEDSIGSDVGTDEFRHAAGKIGDNSPNQISDAQPETQNEFSKNIAQNQNGEFLKHDFDKTLEGLTGEVHDQEVDKILKKVQSEIVEEFKNSTEAVVGQEEIVPSDDVRETSTNIAESPTETGAKAIEKNPPDILNHDYTKGDIYPDSDGQNLPVDQEKMTPGEILNHNFTKEDIKYTVTEHDNALSKILSNKVRELIDSGQYRLPEGIPRDHVVSWMYQRLPEMTANNNIASGLADSVWTEQVGLRTSNPDLIHAGDELNLQPLLDRMGLVKVEAPIPDIASHDTSPLGSLDGFNKPDLTPEVNQTVPFSVSGQQAFDAVAQNIYGNGPVIGDTTAEVAGSGTFDLGYHGLNQVPDNLPVRDIGPNGEQLITPDVADAISSEAPSVSNVFDDVEAYTVGDKIIVSKEYMNIEHKLPKGGSELNDYLSGVIYEGVKSRDLVVPDGTQIKNLGEATTFVETKLEFLTTPQFVGGEPILSKRDLVDIGIPEGSFAKITPDNTLNIGELLKQLLMNRIVSLK